MAEGAITVTVLQIGTGLPLSTSESTLLNPSNFDAVSPVRATPVASTTRTKQGIKYLVTGGGTVTFAGVAYQPGAVIVGDGTAASGGGTLTEIVGVGRFMNNDIIPAAYSGISVNQGIGKQPLFYFVSQSVAAIAALIDPT